MLDLSPDVSSELGIPELGSASQGSRLREVQLTDYNCHASICLPLTQNTEFLKKKETKKTHKNPNKTKNNVGMQRAGAVCKSMTLGEL